MVTSVWRQRFRDAGFVGAVKWIIIASTFVQILQHVPSLWIEGWLGLSPADLIHRGFLWQVVTFGLVSIGLFEWLFNMLVFIFVGRMLESQWGIREFLKYILVTLLAGAACVLIVGWRSNGMAVGASKISLALLVALAVLSPDSTMFLYVVPLPAWLAVAIIVGLELYFTRGLTLVADIGSMLTGFLYLRFGWRMHWPFAAWTERWGRWFERRRRLRNAYKPGVELHEVTDEVAREVDRILDKVLRQGVESLSRRERDLMNKYSRLKH